MSGSGDSAPLNRAARPEGGFDRFDAGARDGWAVLWRSAGRGRFIMGRDRSVWLWDRQVKQWKRLTIEQERLALRDHDRAINRLRRALLAMRTLESRLAAEREAARQAMQRIGIGITRDWEAAGRAEGTDDTGYWFDHPAGLYLAATRDCRNYFSEELQQPFNIKVFAALVAASYDDVQAGARTRPPRLRPEDMALLQVRAPEPQDTPAPIGMTDFMQDFRATLPTEPEPARNLIAGRSIRWVVLIVGAIFVIGLLSYILH